MTKNILKIYTDADNTHNYVSKHTHTLIHSLEKHTHTSDRFTTGHTRTHTRAQVTFTHTYTHAYDELTHTYANTQIYIRYSIEACNFIMFKRLLDLTRSPFSTVVVVATFQTR